MTTTAKAAKTRPLEDQVHAFFGAALGAGVAYAMNGEDMTSLAVGAIAGYFVHPVLVGEAIKIDFLPVKLAPLLPAAATGAFVGWKRNGGDYAMVGAYAAGAAAAQYAVTMY